MKERGSERRARLRVSRNPPPQKKESRKVSVYLPPEMLKQKK
jgi:hypothetical protein